MVKDKVIMGISGAEYGIRGFIDAYDAKTGKRAWRFYTVPRPDDKAEHYQKALKTWEGKSWLTGGGSAWVTETYDPNLNTLYLWWNLHLEETTELRLLDGSASGLRLRPFEVDRHIPRFVPNEELSSPGSVIGLVVEDIRTGGRLIHAPCVGSIGNALAAAAAQADCILLDGTFWDDGEPVHYGIGTRTARQMGHIPVSGPEGSLGWLSGLGARHRLYIRINNINPMLDERGPEYRQVAVAGVKIGADGDQFEL